jgi:hypothetical protein
VTSRSAYSFLRQLQWGQGNQGESSSLKEWPWEGLIHSSDCSNEGREVKVSLLHWRSDLEKGLFIPQTAPLRAGKSRWVFFIKGMTLRRAYSFLRLLQWRQGSQGESSSLKEWPWEGLIHSSDISKEGRKVKVSLLHRRSDLEKGLFIPQTALMRVGKSRWVFFIEGVTLRRAYSFLRLLQWGQGSPGESS